MKKEIKKDCSTCKHLDEVFGDCCHPDSDGSFSVTKALYGCYKKDFAWWEARKNNTELWTNRLVSSPFQGEDSGSNPDSSTK